jgi:hypothetical protein
MAGDSLVGIKEGLKRNRHIIRRAGHISILLLPATYDLNGLSISQTTWKDPANSVFKDKKKWVSKKFFILTVRGFACSSPEKEETSEAVQPRTSRS